MNTRIFTLKERVPGLNWNTAFHNAKAIAKERDCIVSYTFRGIRHQVCVDTDQDRLWHQYLKAPARGASVIGPCNNPTKVIQ